MKLLKGIRNFKWRDRISAREMREDYENAHKEELHKKEYSFNK